MLESWLLNWRFYGLLTIKERDSEALLASNRDDILWDTYMAFIYNIYIYRNGILSDIMNFVKCNKTV